MTGGQGVAGSNPAAPTGSQAFSNIFTLRQSQQKSQLVVQRPLPRPRRARATAPTRAMRQDSRAGEQASQGANDHRATSDLHDDPGQLRTGQPLPRPPADRTPGRSPGYRNCRTPAGQGAQPRPAHTAINARLPTWQPPRGRAATTVAIVTAT